MCGCALKPNFASIPARSIIRAKTAVVNGAPRSDVNTNGDLGSCSRWSRRSARNSSPTMGVSTWGALLDPADVQRGRPKVHLIPAQVNQFGNPQGAHAEN